MMSDAYADAIYAMPMPRDALRDADDDASQFYLFYAYLFYATRRLRDAMMMPCHAYYLRHDADDALRDERDDAERDDAMLYADAYLFILCHATMPLFTR
jgi:hypothetical protein